jgi:hypothetical protein
MLVARGCGYDSGTKRRVRQQAKRGIEFIDENGGGPGVRLRKRQQKKARTSGRLIASCFMARTRKLTKQTHFGQPLDQKRRA